MPEENVIPFTAGEDNFQTLITATLTAPSAGYVLVTATVDTFANAESCPCAFGARIRHDTANAVIFSANGTTPAYSPAFVQVAAVAQAWVYPVAAGPNTFSLEGAQFAGTGTIGFGLPRLTALFVTTGP